MSGYDPAVGNDEWLSRRLRQMDFAIAEATRAASAKANIAPLGSVQFGVWTTSPSASWLLAEGQAVSRAGYPALFAMIGVTYGAGNGTTTFNLPNIKGKTLVGYDSADTDFNAMGKLGGAKDVILTVAQIPAHSHTQNAHTHLQNSHTHIQNTHNHTQNSHSHEMGISRGGNPAAPLGGTGGFTWHETTDKNTATVTPTNNSTIATNQSTTAVNQSTTAINNNTGGGGSHENMPPFIVLRCAIRVL